MLGHFLSFKISFLLEFELDWNTFYGVIKSVLPAIFLASLSSFLVVYKNTSSGVPFCWLLKTICFAFWRSLFKSDEEVWWNLWNFILPIVLTAVEAVFKVLEVSVSSTVIVLNCCVVISAFGHGHTIFDVSASLLLRYPCFT